MIEGTMFSLLTNARSNKSLRVILILMSFFILTSCNANYHREKLQRISKPITVEGTRISMSISNSPQSNARINWGPPWRLKIVSDGSDDLTKLTLETAHLTGDGIDYDWLEKSGTRKFIYPVIKTGEKYLNVSLQEVFDKRIAENEIVQLEIKGTLAKGDKEIPFHDVIEFRSIVEAGTTKVNYLLD